VAPWSERRLLNRRRWSVSGEEGAGGEKLHWVRLSTIFLLSLCSLARKRSLSLWRKSAWGKENFFKKGCPMKCGGKHDYGGTFRTCRKVIFYPLVGTGVLERRSRRNRPELKWGNPKRGEKCSQSNKSRVRNTEEVHGRSSRSS